MPVAIKMRDDYSGDELRRLASTVPNGVQARRLMALAAIADGKNRTQASAIGLMDRQTLRDWVIRFNEPQLWIRNIYTIVLQLYFSVIPACAGMTLKYNNKTILL